MDFNEIIKAKQNRQTMATLPLETGGVALPVKGGRSSVADEQVTLSDMVTGMMYSEPDFHLQVLNLMEHLAKYNPDFSKAVENIITLGNTKLNIYFDDKVSTKQSKEMMARLKAKYNQWYMFSGGITALCNDLFAQACVFGAVSAEAVPSLALDGIQKGVLVTPKDIRFRYVRETDEYKTLQVVKNATNLTMDVELNPATYSYVAIRRYSEKPYGVPPFLAALENIAISKDMVGNMRHVIKKLGMLGFLDVLIKGVKPKPNETDEAYFARTQAYLQRIAPEIEKGVSKGYVIGFDDTHEFKMQPSTSNVSGARDLVELNDINVMSGLKQDPMMFGRNFSTTETLANIIIKVMTAQVRNYQQAVASFLSKMFLLDLKLAGYNVEQVMVEFDPAMIGDKGKEETAYKTKLENLKMLLDNGVIDIQQFAQEAGYEEAADPEKHLALVTPAPPAAPEDDQEDDDRETDNSDETENSKVTLGIQVVDLTDKAGQTVEAICIDGKINGTQVTKLGRVKLSDLTLVDLTDIHANAISGQTAAFPYQLEKSCSCHACTSLNFAADEEADTDPVERFVIDYYKATKLVYDTAVRRLTNKIGTQLAQLGQGAGVQEITDLIVYEIYKEWPEVFTEKQVRVINKFVNLAYRFFRNDKSIFNVSGDTEDNLPNGVFGLIDVRALEYYKKVDAVYLGKFITDPDVKADITEFIRQRYLSRELPIGENKQGMAEFKQQFAQVLQGKDWKIRQIIDTTVSRMRNTASMAYFEQAGVEKYTIAGVKDRKQCDYCKNLQGKTFTVSKAVQAVKDLYETEPEYTGLASPFITAIYKKAEDMKDLTGEELQNANFNLVPAHPLCRDQVIPLFD